MSPSSTDFSNPTNYHLINWGFFYIAIMPYHPKAPVNIFIPDKGDPTRGSITVDPRAFDPDVNNKSPEKQVIVLHKARPVLVIQDNGPNHSGKWSYVLIAPAYSFEEADQAKPFYNSVKKGLVGGSLFVPAGTFNGRESRVDLQDMMCIHKSMLREKISDQQFLVGRKRDEALGKMKGFLAIP